LVTTRYVIDEVSKALRTKEFKLDRERVVSLLSWVHGAATVHEDLKEQELKKHFSRLDDKKDVHVLSAFEKLRCDILVTGDKELLKKVTGAMTTRRVLRMLLAER
jgi:predicted nucleic acid-binding protein